MRFARTSVVCSGMVAMGCLFALPGHAESYLVLGDSVEPGSVSGLAATEKKINVGEFDAPYLLFFDGDSGARIEQPHCHDLRRDQGRHLGRRQGKPCDIEVDAKALVSGLGYGDSKTAAIAQDGNFGIRLYIAEVRADDSVIALNHCEQDKHTNCAAWRAAVNCPAGHIASGLRVHHRDDYFTGLGLKCRKVEVGSQPHKS